MSNWRATTCSLCYVNCGLLVQVEQNRITRVRGDHAHPRSKGYLCQKAQLLGDYSSHEDRLTSPLRRRPDGTHEPISWHTALTEIAERLRAVRNADEAAGRVGSFALVGGGGQGNHSAGPFATSLMKWMRSTRFFNPLSQEKTGDFWVNGRLFGGQTVHTAEDIDRCDLLVVIGANPWMAHGFARARAEITDIRNDPDRKLLVIDPRRTETAEAADLHLALQPGTDAFLLGAILALLASDGGLDDAFLQRRTEGADLVLAALERVPVDDWIARSGVPRAQVEEAVRLIRDASAMSVRAELGIQQGRNSTLTSYLEKLLYLLPGHFGRPGTNAVHSWLQPLWTESRGERSPITGFEYIAGLLPMNTLAEELDPQHPDRARVLWVDSSNPANTVVDTDGIERAIRGCELSVVIDIAFSETAALADYVLPAASQNEKWEYALFTFEWPENVFALRPPLLAPPGEARPEPDIYLDLFRTLGALPHQSALSELTAHARSDRGTFMTGLREVLASDPDLAAIAPVLMYATLGATLPQDAALAAVLWPACHRTAQLMETQVQRALGTPLAGPALGELLFERVLDSSHGLVFSHHEYDEVWSLLRREQIQLAVPELLDWLVGLESRETDVEFPLSLINGQRRSHNANQILRTPRSRRRDPYGALHARAEDLAERGFTDGDWVAVVTRHGRVVVRAEVDPGLRRRQIALPHGYGMAIPDGRGGRVWHGPRINLLSDPLDRDPIAGTPHHKDTPARLEPPDAAELQAARSAENVIAELRKEHRAPHRS